MYKEIQINCKTGYIDVYVEESILERMIWYYDALGFWVVEYTDFIPLQNIPRNGIIWDEIKTKEYVMELMNERP